MNEGKTMRLRVCTFKGVQNLPLYVAERQGFFAARGLDVDIVYTAGSRPQLAGLARGDYSLIQTAPDNVIHMDNNPAAFGLDAETAPPVVLLCGGSVGALRVNTQPGLTAFDDLRGAQLGVDNPTSGFALVLRDILAQHGLTLEQDYTFTVTGGTSARLDALRAGAVAATILYAPYDALAEEEGYGRLASSTDYYAAYASLATAVTRDWAEAHADVVTGYLVAVLQALRWIYEPDHAEIIQELMRQEPALTLSAAMAAHAYTAFRDPTTGFDVDAALDDAGVEQVIALRDAYGDPPRPLGRPADYRDPRWYERARASF
jgi:ABC-type nitrate/sulfonate/bicarbonate transport system substrate-binding protein